jgi:membrane-bound metal-dependent hydrolase YbcI (DUF457 family)
LDNVTHTLVGLTLVRAGLGRRTPGATAAIVLASNAPDIDIVSALAGGAVSYLSAHRGPTHGILGVFALALISAGLVWVWARVRRHPAEARGSFVALAGVALAGTALHVLMDLPTSYGIRLLSPFDNTWYALDWLPIVDVYLWGLLIGGLIVMRLGRARRMAVARAVLGLALAFYAVRAVAQYDALRIAASTRADGTQAPCATAPVLSRHPTIIEAASAGPGACLQAAALPTFFSPFTWQLIRQQTDGYELRQISILGNDTPPERVWVPSESDQWVAAARRTETGRVFLNFSRMPATRAVTRPDGTHRVRLLDVRFVGGPFQFEDEPRARPPFLATIDIAPDGHVIRQGLGP